MSIYPEAEWVPMAGSSLFTGGPKRLVLHTTEGWSIESALSAYRAKTIAPQFTVDFVARRWLQHVDTDRAASAMANLSGGVQTNRDGAVQMEIVGFAAYTQDISDMDLRWLGQILRLICEREGIDLNNHPAFVGTEAGTIATTTAPQRMSYTAWENFNGVCGHQHVPENHHWDPGRFPYDRMLELSTTSEDPMDYLNYEEQRRLLKKIDDMGSLFPFVKESTDMIPEIRDLVKGLPAAVVAALPPSSTGGPTTAQLQEAVRSVIIEQLGPIFDLPGDN
jgi:hypothetical protein